MTTSLQNIACGSTMENPRHKHIAYRLHSAQRKISLRFQARFTHHDKGSRFRECRRRARERVRHDLSWLHPSASPIEHPETNGHCEVPLVCRHHHSLAFIIGLPNNEHTTSSRSPASSSSNDGLDNKASLVQHLP